MRALRDMNLPKFVFEDVPLFLGLIGDLFPGLDCPRVRYPNFNDAVEAVLEDNGYKMLDIQVMHQMTGKMKSDGNQSVDIQEYCMKVKICIKILLIL